MKKNLFYILTAMLMTACSSEDIEIISYDNTISDNKENDSHVSVSKDGYLVFDSSQSLENYVEIISCSQQLDGSTRVIQ